MVLFERVLSMAVAKSSKLKLAILFFLALLLRVIAALVLGSNRVTWDYEYEAIADNLVKHGTYAYSFYGLGPLRPTSFMPPVYPLFLALLRWCTGDIPWLYKVFQIVISSLTVLVLYALTYDLSGKEIPSLLAGLIMAVYPPLVAYGISINTVTFETFFVIVGIWSVLRAVKRNSVFAASLVGLTLSLAALTRATWLALLLLLLIWMVAYPTSKPRRRMRQVVVLIIVAVLVLSPWIVRNYLLHGKVVVTSTNGGLNFWIGNNPNATGEYIFPTRINRDLVLSVADRPELERDRVFYAQGLAFVRRNPYRFLSLFCKKLFYFLFFRPNIGSSYSTADIPLFEWAKIGFIVSWLALLPFAFLGLLHAEIGTRAQLLLALPLVTSAIISAIYFVGTRFRTPADGLVIIWASFGLFHLYGRWKSRSGDASP